MRRSVEREWLDHLAPVDPKAMAARRDLQRVNGIMGHARMLARRLPAAIGRPRSILELGAGDGTWLVRLAHALPPEWTGVRVVLLDRQDAVPASTLAALSRRGWRPEVVIADAAAWLASPRARFDLVVVNLFLHHFEGEALRCLLRAIAGSARAFAASEPRRSAAALRLSRLLGLIGCNAVTRHDAELSVRAGFSGRELGALWPRDPEWQVSERDCGWLTHLFLATREGGADA